jgi:hypothetical protein
MQAARPMLLTFFALLFLFCYSSCHSSSAKKEASVRDRPLPDMYKPDSAARYTGVYTGNFGMVGTISLVLNYISGKTVSGYDVHMGLRRNINGEVTWEGGKLHFQLKEPGDNRFDGAFDFTLDTASRKIEGEWTQQSPDKMVMEQTRITLTRMQWDENAEDNEWKHIDTALHFRSNGTCQLEIVPPDTDYSKQKTVVRGNYSRVGDTFQVAWEKNPYMGEFVKMVEHRKKVPDAGRDSTYRLLLEGGGMSFGIKGEADQ